MTLLDRYGVDRAINASGRMTRLGVNTLSEDVIAAMVEAGRNYVDIEQLHDRVGSRIAELLETEDAMITSGAAAGVAIMVAAAIAGEDLAQVHNLPLVAGERTKVLIQAGHQVQFGAPINQMIRLGGGEPFPIGQVNSVMEQHLTGAIDDRAAAFVYVQSHHAVQKGMLSLRACIEICGQHGIPVLVDAAAEEDLKRFTSSGATAVTYSGGKAIGGPTSGIIAGDRALIRACRAQNRGIGRPMKIGKEQLLGLAVALERYLERDDGDVALRCSETVDRLLEGFSRIDSVRTQRLPDEAGRGLERAGIVLEPEMGQALVEHLASGRPPIFPRTHLLNTGIVAFDPRPLARDDIDIIIQRVRTFFDGK